jgi:hypothetical protein
MSREDREWRIEDRRAARRRLRIAILYFLSSLLFSFCVLCGEFRAADSASWGSDHVGKSLPQFAGGDECLFCHRTDVGPLWAANRHNRTLRRADPDAPALAALQKDEAAQVQFLLGSGRRQRFLKSATAYGKLEMFSVAFDPAAGKLADTEVPKWDASRFADACAGCHCTAVDAKTRAFTAHSLDCFACHGDVPEKHAKDTTLVHLAKKRQDPARVVTSICAQCHLRGGKSRSTGLPYPNQFVPGDNLFRDFEANLRAERIKALNPADRHVADNVRDVVLLGKEDVSCLSCHEIHKQSSKKHHRMAVGETCWNCHTEGASKKEVKEYDVHSETCGY